MKKRLYKKKKKEILIIFKISNLIKDELGNKICQSFFPNPLINKLIFIVVKKNYKKHKKIQNYIFIGIPYFNKNYCILRFLNSNKKEIDFKIKGGELNCI